MTEQAKAPKAPAPKAAPKGAPKGGGKGKDKGTPAGAVDPTPKVREGTPRLQTYMRLLTDSAAYAWVHRVSFLAVGTADMKELYLRYDLFAVRTGINPLPSDDEERAAHR